MIPRTAIVWFRRDLRLSDHRALACAIAQNHAVIPLFVYDDALLHHPLTGSGRVRFMLECHADLDANLRRRGGYLVTRRGVPHEQIARLCHETGATRLYYHEDTDRLYGRERDEALQRLLPGIEVIAVPDNGVFFAQDARQGWAKKWEVRMAEEMVPAPDRIPQPPDVATLGVLTLAELGLPLSDQIHVTPGGESWAQGRMREYLRSGVNSYRSSIGSPWNSEEWGTSRLSAPLSFGCISLRTVVQASLAEQGKHPLDTNRKFWHSRLYWHDHFTQKQRDWPQAQYQTINPAYDSIRQTLNSDYFAAWTTGRTGYPLADAAMRALSTTGFLNFRMRAMVSALWSYDLWQPWQVGAEWFQKQLLDFDTGINHQQWQMQAGCVGTHANRFYNFTEQAYRFDPLGLYIARHVPELAPVPMPLRVTPWQMTADEQARYGVRIGRDYPAPIVDHAEATRFARAEFKRLAPAARAFLATEEGQRRISSERSRSQTEQEPRPAKTKLVTRPSGQLALEF